MIVTKLNSTQSLFDKLQQLKGETILNLYQSKNKFYDEMGYRRRSKTFQFEEDPFSKNAEGFSTIYHDVFF